LLEEYFQRTGKQLKKINYNDASIKPLESIRCPVCDAPFSYVYINNGKKKSQFLCKVCDHTFSNNSENIKNKSRLLCPYCDHNLFVWKDSPEVTIYKCQNDDCAKYIEGYSKLNARERKLLDSHSSQFKLRYQYRDYHFKVEELEHSGPEKPKVSITKIRNPNNLLGLILTFYVSFATSARKTALMLKMMYNISISHQTVLNYAEAAAYYCHAFNLKYKGDIDDIQAGDETYIKINAVNNYTFFFISSKKKSISAYHVDNNRGVLPATIAMIEAKRSAKQNQNITFITDGNPSYLAGLNYLNNSQQDNIAHHRVIGLKNLDSESETYREFKQIIERLNGTYKYHMRAARGFKSMNGAVALTTLFVTYYNFLRPHSSINYNTPVIVPELQLSETIQNKWYRVISMAYG
jgi:putative transposase